MKLLVFELSMLRHYCLINETVLEYVTDFYLILFTHTIVRASIKGRILVHCKL